jgi:hypothetical protein
MSIKEYTPRTRFIRHALFEPVDRPPRIETHGFWPQTVERWHNEGLPRHVRHKCQMADFKPGDITIEEYFEMEVYAWPSCIGSAAATPFWPPFERKVLEENDAYVVFQNHNGIVCRDIKQGRSMPQFLKFPVTCREDWEELKPRLNPNIEERYAAARQTAAEGFNARTNLIPYVVCGTYGLPRNLFGEENLSYAFYDDPDLIRDILDTWLRFYVENARRFTQIVDFDFVYFWEDLAYKTGPLISPKLAEEFIFPYYRQLIAEMKGMGLKVFCLDTDGNAKVLMDGFVEAGINNFLPCEIAADMEPAWILQRYGRRCSVQGGIDKRTLTRGKKQIEAEVLRKGPALLGHGGYVPGVDHAVPSDVPFENFCYLVELLRR